MAQFPAREGARVGPINASDSQRVRTGRAPNSAALDYRPSSSLWLVLLPELEVGNSLNDTLGCDFLN